MLQNLQPQKIHILSYLITCFLFSLVCTRSYAQTESSEAVPAGFEYIHKIIPDAVYDIRYAGEKNFTGRPVPGYLAETALLTKEALMQLKAAADELRKKGYRLLIYDAYRPQKAVDSFVSWARDPADTLSKSEYYPDLPKNQLFPLGYIASRSGHTRGSTIDLTLIDAQSEEPLDMGSPHDYFGEISHHTTSTVTAEQKSNRELLRTAMVRNGFRSYSKEWWHYTLRHEPYPDTYFDFDVQ